MLYLLDAGAILNAPGFRFSREHRYITTDAVVSEMRDLISRNFINAAIAQKSLDVQNPDAQALSQISKKAEGLGLRLSNADKSILALALELRAKKRSLTLITDDKSVQNLASALNFRFLDVLHGRISETLKFIKKCPVCGKEYSSYVEECPNCGTRLQRKGLKIN